ncbi:hypothetical protein SUDANB21_05368 [Streptomyces sp. enrichment culture]
MVRVNQTSNPRSVVVLSSGTDWRTRAAGQKRSSGAESEIPRKQPAKIRALQQAISLANMAISKKNWSAARYALTSILRDGPPTESVDRFAFCG